MIVTAENFVQGGRTIGHLEDGRIVFLNGLFPGEEAEIKIVEEKEAIVLLFLSILSSEVQ